MVNGLLFESLNTESKTAEELYVMSYVNVNAERFSSLGEIYYSIESLNDVRSVCLNLQSIELKYLKPIVNLKLIEWNEQHFIKNIEI